MSIRLSQRLQQLASEYGDELEVLAVAEGSFEQEKALHGRFAHLRAVGEWFEPGDDLVGFIVAEGRAWDGKDETTSIDIRIRMDTDLAEYLQQVAEDDRVSVAAYIRALVLKDRKQRKGGSKG